jgi:hypothetical protein
MKWWKIGLIIVVVSLIILISLYLLKNLKENNSEDVLIFQEACQEEGYAYISEGQICTGAYVTFLLFEDDETSPEVTCCMNGNIYDKLILPEEFDKTWISLKNEGECNVKLIDSINNCLPYKCSFLFCPGSTVQLERGIVMEENGICYYYSETVGKDLGLYCKLDSNSRLKLVNYFENISLNYQQESCSIKGSSNQIGQVTNQLEELISSGDCQYWDE